MSFTNEHLQNKIIIVSLYRVFHGIRLLRLRKIGCRETINFFLYLCEEGLPLYFVKLFVNSSQQSLLVQKFYSVFVPYTFSCLLSTLPFMLFCG